MTVHKFALQLLRTVAGLSVLAASSGYAADPQIEALFEQATVAYERGAYDVAIDKWQQVIEIDSEHPAAHYDLCAAFNKTENVRNAMTHCDRAIGIDPQYVDAFYVRGLILTEKLGELERGILDFDTVLRLDENEARAYFKRGNARARLGDNKGAQADYTDAIRLEPNDADAYFNRGVVMYTMQDASSALEDMIRSAEICADNGNTAGRDKAANAIQQILNSVKNQ